MTKQYIIKRFFPGETETETPYYMTVGRGWGYTSNIADATFFKNPENAFVKLNKIRESVDGDYGTMVIEVEFKETHVKLKVETIHTGGSGG